MIQMAMQVGFDRVTGDLIGIEVLNSYLRKGWKIVDTCASGGGNILVVLEDASKDPDPPDR